MLFLTNYGFLNVVFEPQFIGVFTLQTNDRSALEPFEDRGPSTVMVNANDITYPYVLHVRKEIVAEVLDCPALLWECELATKPVSAKPFAFAIEGFDRDYAQPVLTYSRPDELPGLTDSLHSLENIAIYPMYVDVRKDMNRAGGKF